MRPLKTDNLQKIKWVLPAYTHRKEYLAEFERIIGKLVQESENP